MSKELETLEKLKEHLKYEWIDNLSNTEYYDILSQALQRLESIENANPSKALECLESIKDALWDDDFHYQRHSKLLDTIEQALLKAQEQKQYLKWEDLKFDEEEQWLKVKMGDRNYTLIYWKFTLLGKEYYTSELRNEETLDIIQHIRGKLFNDLHLERVEE